MENIEEIKSLEITIGQLIMLFNQNKLVTIKPMGHLNYYKGMMDDIPNSLHNIVVREIGTGIRSMDDENSNQKFYTEIWLYVDKLSWLEEGLNESFLEEEKQDDKAIKSCDNS